MKLCTYFKNNSLRVGALTDTGIADVTEAAGGSMDALIRGGSKALLAVKEAVRKAAAVPEGSVEFGKVNAPEKILCVGLNYKQHARETGGEPPEEPVFFNKFTNALCPDGHEVELPDWHRCYDYEAELVIVMGKTCYHVSEEAAGGYIFGYTCGNDLSARDCQFINGQWLSGKSLPDFAPAGPYIQTADCFDPTAANSISCVLNGKTVQNSDTSDMIFSCAKIVSRASDFFKLEPGDLIFTGTPSGVILGQPKGSRVWLKPGDTVSVSIEGIGTLTNKMI